jgi:hypothetical protein
LLRSAWRRSGEADRKRRRNCASYDDRQRQQSPAPLIDCGQFRTRRVAICSESYRFD